MREFIISLVFTGVMLVFANGLAWLFDKSDAEVIAIVALTVAAQARMQRREARQ